MPTYQFDSAWLHVQGASAQVRWASPGDGQREAGSDFALCDVANAYVTLDPGTDRLVLVIQLSSLTGAPVDPPHHVIGLSPNDHATASAVVTWLHQVIAHYRGAGVPSPPAGGSPWPGNGRWLDRAVAGSRVALSNARTAGMQLVSDLDAQYGGNPDYRGLRTSLGSAKDQAKGAIAELRQQRHDAIDQLAATPAGAAVGERTRQFSAVVGKLPVLSAITDAALSRHGVAVLLERFKEEPDDPTRALLLAEALLRVRKDLLRYRVVRSVTSPTYLVISQSIRTAGAIGTQDADPPETVLLKRAFAGARRRIRSNPLDAEALHVLARVYLARQYVVHAERFAKAAFMAGPRDPLPLVTVARTQLESGRTEEARHTAERAVAKGAGFGNEILARLVLAQAANDADVARYETLRAAVSPQDHIDYLGVAVSGGAWWDEFKQRQQTKARQLMSGTDPHRA